MTKTDYIRIRLTPDEKKYIKGKAKELGATLTDVIVTRVKDLPLRDYRFEKVFFSTTLQFTNKVNHIGNNINQAVMSLHQIRNNQKLPDYECEQLMMELKNTQKMLNDFSFILEKAFFNH